METRAHYALIGLFVLAGVGVAAAFVLWLSQAQFNQEFDTYDVVFYGPPRGLSTASEVRFNGIDVGDVISVRFDEFDSNNVLARIRIDASTPVKTDSLARLEPQGITGLAYIQITPGGRNSPDAFAQGDLDYPRIESEPAALDAIFEGGQDVVQSANTALRRANTALSRENIDNLTVLLANLRTLSDELVEHRAMVGEAHEAIAQLNAASGKIDEAADAFLVLTRSAQSMLDDQLTPALIQTEAAARDVEIAAAEFGAFLAALEPALLEFAQSGLPELALAAGDIRRLTAALERIALDLENDPGAFLSGAARPETEIAP